MHRVAASLAIALGLCAQAIAPPVAEAHERRNVGPYLLVVGWLSEPAFQGQANAASVRVSDTRVEPARPVEGLEQTLAVAVSAGGLAPRSGRPRAVFGQPGLYALDLIPTQAGAYTFRITGTIGDLEVDETFESGPGRFNEVESASGLQYQAKVPSGAELTDRLDDIDRRLGTAAALAIAALAVAIVLPVAVAVRARRSRR